MGVRHNKPPDRREDQFIQQSRPNPSPKLVGSVGRVDTLNYNLIHTCQLCGANSFDYLVQMQRHAEDLARNPAEWMPWNYRDTLHPTAGIWRELPGYDEPIWPKRIV